MKNAMKLAVALVTIGSIGIWIPTCPIDAGRMVETGATRTQSGEVQKEFKCASGHSLWAGPGY